MTTKSAIRESAAKWAGRVLAPILWAYALIHLTIVDLDAPLARLLGSAADWPLRYKPVVLLAAMLSYIGLLGTAAFGRFLVYLAVYPLVITFQLLLPRLARHWALLLVFLPATIASVQRFWSTFTLYGLGVVGVTIALNADSAPLAFVALSPLIPLLVVHYYRSLRRAYAASPLTQLAGYVRGLRRSFEDGTVAPWNTAPASATSGGVTGAPASTSSPKQQAYTVHALARVVAEKVGGVAKRRYYDLYLIASWIYTVVLTVVTFAIVYFSLFRFDKAAFDQAAGAGIWSFLGYSLSKFTPASVSPILPHSDIAFALTYAEALLSLLVLVILVFSVLTSAREAFKDEMDSLTRELDGVVKACETRIAATWKVTIIEFETQVSEENLALVNTSRKMQGLPELPRPTSTSS